MNHSKFKTANIRLLLVIIVPVLCLRPVIAAPVTGLPNESQVIRALFNNLNAAFPASQSCAEQGSTPVTVQTYLQTTLIYLAQEKTNGNQLQVKCDKAKLNAELIEYYQAIQVEFSGNITKALRKLTPGEVLYQCEVAFNYSAGENVWSRGVQFLIQDKTGQAIKHSFRCLMTP